MTVIVEYDVNDKPEAHIITISDQQWEDRQAEIARLEAGRKIES